MKNLSKILLVPLLLFNFNLFSQSPGDIAFIAFNADGDDDLAFVVLTDISQGTVIYFTDNEWTGSAFNDTNEGYIKWTASSNVSAGNVVVLTDLSGSESVNIGTVSEHGNFNIGASDECVWALDSAPSTSYGSTPNFYGVICNDITNGNTTSGTGLSLGSNGVNFDNDQDGFLYTGTRSNQTASSFLSLIYNSSNWEMKSSNGELILPIPTTAFIISGESNNQVPTNHPTNFVASALHETINLSWTDAAAGTQVPEKYVIIGETDSDITNPSNGSPISNDIVASDGRIVLNISQGTESASFSNVGNSTWHFEIFPYTNSGSNILYKTDETIQTSNVITNAIQITEINYNNTGTDYEWIELYNPTNGSIDISSYTVIDNGNNTLATLPSSTTINSESYFVIVVNGSGNTPPNFNSDYDPGSPYDSGALNNSGDSVILKDSSGNIVDQVDYDDSSPWPTTPDGSSYFTLELSSLTSNNFYGSNWQGSLADYGSPGQKSTEAWDTNNTSSSDLNINNSEHRVISTDAAINNIIVSSGSSLTINKNGSLTVSGNFTNNGTVTLNSDADEFSSIIVEGTSSGNITYNRYVNTVGSGEWDLIGSPVGGLSISSFITANGSSLASNGTQYAIGRHFNDTDSWKNYASDGDGTNTLAITGDFNLGEGYQMASTSGETLAFTGTVATSAQTQSVINNDGNGSGGRRFNLVANPFPSYLNLNTQAHATNNFLKVNIDSGVIDSNFGYLYGWDADGTGYTIYNNNAGDGLTDYIAPGQGFFIAAASSGSISFTTAMHTTSGGDDFVSGRLAQSAWSRFYLRLYENESFASETQFYFEEGLSLGLDPGHDAGAPFEDILMSRLPDNDQGIGMAINAMGLSALDEETVIPLVLNRDAGVEFSISFEDSTIPEDVDVYLEDTLLETLTDLRSEDFTLTPESDLSDMGRFYLRIGNTSLGGNDLDESYISIYKAASDDFVTIEGLSNVEKANVQLFNIIGQEVLNTTLNSNQSTQRVSTSGLTTGVYVIRLQADSSVISKKIIIN